MREDQNRGVFVFDVVIYLNSIRSLIPNNTVRPQTATDIGQPSARPDVASQPFATRIFQQRRTSVFN